MQAILIKCYPATDTKSARIMACCQSKRMTFPRDYALTDTDNALNAAKALIEALGWSHVEIGGIGQLPCGDWCATLKEKAKCN